MGGTFKMVVTRSAKKPAEAGSARKRNQSLDDVSFADVVNFAKRQKTSAALSAEPPKDTKRKGARKWDYFGGHFNAVLDDSEATTSSRHSKISVQLPSFTADVLPAVRSFWNYPDQILTPTSANFSKSIVENCDTFTQLQTDLLQPIARYMDVHYARRQWRHEAEIRQLYCCHAVNHVIKTRNQVLRHNAKLKAVSEKNADGCNMVIDDDQYRDQGLARPKVLILVPFRSCALKIVQQIISLLFVRDGGSKVMVTNKKRFMDEYGGESSWLDKRSMAEVGAEMKALFSGNTDDGFRIGLGLAKKSLKLYCDFYKADILIASPLGLRMAIGSTTEADYEFDFLSAIELLIFDQTDVYLMQNWQHVVHIMEHLNRIPKDAHGVDFNRVRLWSLNGWSQRYRQTLLFSDLGGVPEINSLMSAFCSNYAGALHVAAEYPTNGVLDKIQPCPSFVLHKITCESPADDADARFKHFIETILRGLLDKNMQRTMLVVPSYYDFVRLRNHFKREAISFVQICEYSSMKKVSRARDLFYHGKKQFLIITERFHFFRRYKIKGAHNVVFYQPPVYASFLADFCRMAAGAVDMDGRPVVGVYSLAYCRHDVGRLAYCFGVDTAARLASAERATQILESDG